MASLEHAPHPTLGEEIVHAATHGIGALLSLGTLVALVAEAALSGRTTSIVAAAVFGTSLCLVYASSTAYHATPARWVRLKAVLQVLDHAAIHLLIAGTFTPFALCAIGGAWGWALLAASWSIAVVGIVVETTPLRHRARLSISLYVGSGWAGVLALPLLWAAVTPGTLGLLASGGVAYTAGVPFFLAHPTKWMHAYWHGFVLAGSALHVAAVALVLG